MLRLTSIAAAWRRFTPAALAPQPRSRTSTSAGERTFLPRLFPFALKGPASQGAFPAFPPLTPSDARRLAEDDGLITRGAGCLRGELVIRRPAGEPPRVELVTAGLGARAERSFVLDLPLAQAARWLRRGRTDGERHVRVEVEADWSAGQARRGERCRLRAQLPSRHLDAGDELDAAGRVVRVWQTGNARSIPLGYYLALAEPCWLDGQRVDELYLPGEVGLSLHQPLRVTGRVDWAREGERCPVAALRIGGPLGAHHEQDPPPPLDEALLARISDLGDWDALGTGTLAGRLGEDAAGPLLETSRWGAAAKVFRLALAPGQRLPPNGVGRLAEVEGLIQHGPRAAQVTVQAIRLCPEPPVNQEGARVRLRGMLHRHYPDSGATAVPILTLAEPILLGPHRIQQLVLDLPAADLPSGVKLECTGDLRLQAGPGGAPQGAQLTAVCGLRHPAEMDAFFVDVEDLTQDLPYPASARLRVRVPAQRS